MSALANKYPGTCIACQCHVAPGAGKIERAGYGRRSRWLVWCGPCFDRSDNSGAEDRECGNRAYEDRCAEACGL